ncbi:hypothetical protein L1987_06016 [Smallanthus sonchifolius]|uniref:Uncharacterized protein n=1 Tax=Smallanthus sonchifolius TaxID=185202 RepID=A0ACB9JX75_9ASTR|nr:hypothetical protein L1987_06016 [Smallanthus sonchifolius]
MSPYLLVERSNLNWRTHLKFHEEAKDLIYKLLYNVEKRLGTKDGHEIKAHPWLKGIEWENCIKLKLHLFQKLMASRIPKVLRSLKMCILYLVPYCSFNC